MLPSVLADLGRLVRIPSVSADPDATGDLQADAEILITGVEDPDTRAHGANESLHLAMFERACVAGALLLDRLGRQPH